MADLPIVAQKDDLLYPQSLFERPLNRLQMPQIGLIGGGLGGLKLLNDTYKTMLDCDNRIILAVPRSIQQMIGQTADLIFEPVSRGRYDDSLIVERLGEANLIVLAPGMAMTSQDHIRLDKIINQLERPIMITTEALPIVVADPSLLARAGSSLVLSTEQAIALANKYNLPIDIKPARGVYNRLAIMDSLSAHTNATVVIVEKNQIALHHHSLKQAGLLQMIMADFDRQLGQIIGVLSALSAGQTQPDKQFEAMMNGLFLLRQSIDQTESNIGQILKNIL